MLKIGDFSKLAHVTIKTLRHYDEVGLLHPVWIDRYTGYRYYNLDQLPRLNRILALKDLGFTLDQVRELLDEDLSQARLRALFNQKQAELRQKLAADQARLERVAERLRLIEREGSYPASEVTIKAVPAQTVASTRACIASLPELAPQSSEMRAKVDAWVLSAGLRPAGQWLLLYHNPGYQERDLDVEVALLLSSDARHDSMGNRQGTGQSNIGLNYLPAVETMASFLFPSFTSSTSEAYATLFEWAERGSYRACGPVREISLIDPDQTGSRTGFTEVQLPVESSMALKQRLLTQLNRKEYEMEPKIVSLPSFVVVGIRYFGKNENQEISEVWKVANSRASEIQHVVEDSAYGVCSWVEGAAPGEFEYLAGLKVGRADQIPEGMVARQVPSQTYAVFRHTGSLEQLPSTYEYIYHSWLPQSGYKLTGGPDFEFYNEEFHDFSPDSRFYIYVPIQ